MFEECDAETALWLRSIEADWQNLRVAAFLLPPPPPSGLRALGPSQAWRSQVKAIASRSLSAGEIVAISPAFSFVVAQNMKDRLCNCCLTRKSALPSGKLQRCSGCHDAHYCGAECQKKAWTDHLHRLECPAIKATSAELAPLPDPVREEIDLACRIYYKSFCTKVSSHSVAF